ncbi:MAG: hypothetical protein K9M51_00345 [Candidatus Gracilibacteria bacterium]|nr:hypothetical protein [Candidatus Gracilibacteria bacterium]
MVGRAGCSHPASREIEAFGILVAQLLAANARTCQVLIPLAAARRKIPLPRRGTLKFSVVGRAGFEPA